MATESQLPEVTRSWSRHIPDWEAGVVGAAPTCPHHMQEDSLMEAMDHLALGGITALGFESVGWNSSSQIFLAARL